MSGGAVGAMVAMGTGGGAQVMFAFTHIRTVEYVFPYHRIPSLTRECVLLLAGGPGAIAQREQRDCHPAAAADGCLRRHAVSVRFTCVHD